VFFEHAVPITHISCHPHVSALDLGRYTSDSPHFWFPCPHISSQLDAARIWGVRHIFIWWIKVRPPPSSYINFNWLTIHSCPTRYHPRPSSLCRWRHHAKSRGVVCRRRPPAPFSPHSRIPALRSHAIRVRLRRFSVPGSSYGIATRHYIKLRCPRSIY